MEKYKENINKSKNLENIYNITWEAYLDAKLEKKHYDNLKIGLINVPCGGYGDVIKCKNLYDYFCKWYPTANIKICSTSIDKFRNLGISDKIISLKHKYDDGECKKFSQLKIDYKIVFDLFLVIPIINRRFDLNDFKKLFPYANNWNTYTMSEYNDKDNGPYDFPIGVGENYLGLFLNNFKYKKQHLIKNPYALIYIQPSPEWGVHSKYCFLSFLEMICKKYSKKHKLFEIVIPSWIEEELVYDNIFKNKTKNIIMKYFKSSYLKLKNEENLYQIYYQNNNNQLIFRGDILPQPRDIFVGLINDSVNDILLTGDESVIDTLSNFPEKTIWYQIAPWKKDLAYNLFLETGNKNYKTFKTACGSIIGKSFKNDVKNLIKNNDFRIKGKKRMNALLIGLYDIRKNKDIQKMIELIDHSRYLETLKKKIKNI